MTPKPHLLAVNPKAIPAELRSMAAWIGWKLALRNGRWSKEPITIRTGLLAETDNPAIWCDFQSAIDNYRQVGCDGIGLCRTGDQVFIDLDGVLDSTGAAMSFPWASAILSTVRGRAYVEKSATGTGIHAICRGNLPAGRRQLDISGAEHIGFAFYDKSRFFTFTGSVLPQSGAIQDLSRDLDKLHRELFPPKAKSPVKDTIRSLSLGDSELLERARRAKNGHKFSPLWDGNWQDRYPSQSEADLALCCHLAFWTGCYGTRMDSLFRQSGLYRPDKWERADYRDRTIATAIDQTGEVYEPNSPGGDYAAGRYSYIHARRIERRETESPDLLHGYDPQDVGNGQRFRAMYGDIVRWCPEIKKYLVWDSRRWKPDDDDHVRHSGDQSWR